jgi:hypothetical protein
MANTYTLINSYAATGSVANIDFTSIPGTYTDLLIVASLRSSVADASGLVTINNSGTTYTNKRLYSTGSGVSSDSYSTTNLNAAGGSNASTYTANTFSNFSIYFPNYLSSNYKSFSSDAVSENNASTAYSTLAASLWSNTAAITSIKLAPGSGNFVQYSTAYLYGINNS